MFKNHCPHALHVHDDAGSITTIPTEPVPARADVDYRHAGVVDGVQLYTRLWGAVQDLPPYTKGVFPIVSSITADAARLRSDLLVPGAPVRDDKGQVVGCLGLVWANR